MRFGECNNIGSMRVVVFVVMIVVMIVIMVVIMVMFMLMLMNFCMAMLCFVFMVT